MLRGNRRIFYKGTEFAEGLIVTARLILPDLTETEITLTDANGGVYYFDYCYNQYGSYGIVISEDGVKTLFSTILVDDSCCCNVNFIV